MLHQSPRSEAGKASRGYPGDVDLDLERAVWDVDYRNFVKTLLNAGGGRRRE